MGSVTVTLEWAQSPSNGLANGWRGGNDLTTDDRNDGMVVGPGERTRLPTEPTTQVPVVTSWAPRVVM